jgi:hypothetical protein
MDFDWNRQCSDINPEAYGTELAERIRLARRKVCDGSHCRCCLMPPPNEEISLWGVCSEDKLASD